MSPEVASKEMVTEFSLGERRRLDGDEGGWPCSVETEIDVKEIN